jgi:hypothetical protein
MTIVFSAGTSSPVAIALTELVPAASETDKAISPAALLLRFFSIIESRPL